MSASKTQPQPVPIGMITTLIIVAVAAAFLIKPDKKELLERHLKDRNYEAAAKTLATLDSQTRSKDEAFFDAVEIEVELGTTRWRDKARLDDLAKRSLGLLQKHPESERVFELFLHLAGRSSNPAELLDGLVSIKGTLYKKWVALASETLAGRALAVGDPKAAGQIALGLLEIQNARSVTNAVALLRQGGGVDKALEVLRQYLQAHPPQSRGAPWDLERLEIQLLRETGRPGEALVRMRALHDQATGEDRQNLVGPMIQLAREAGKSGEVLEMAERRAKSEPSNTAHWELLAELALESGETAVAVRARESLAALKPDDKNNAFKLGQLREWNQNPSGAYDEYLKALDLTSEEALHRLIALNPGLYRDKDLLAAMTRHPEKVKRLDLEAVQARLLTANGRLAEAERIFKNHVAGHPKDTNAWHSLANTALSLHDYETAREAFGAYFELKPNSPDIAAAMARLEGYLGDFEEAFKWSKRAFELDPTDDNLEVYLNTAESLGRTDDLQAALELKARMSQNPGAVVYLRLAGLLASTGQEEAQLDTLNAALALHPTNSLLRAQAAYFHADRRNYAKAVSVLGESPSLRTDPVQMELYLRMLVQSLKLEEADKFLKEPLPSDFLEQTSTLATRAYLAEVFNRLEESVSLFERLSEREPSSDYYALNYARLLSRTGRVKEAMAILEPRLDRPTPEVMELAANVFAAAGDPRSAIAWQQRFIATGPEDLSQAERVLGDYYLSRGNPIEAKRAYKRALDLFVKVLETEQMSALTSKGTP